MKSNSRNLLLLALCASASSQAFAQDQATPQASTPECVDTNCVTDDGLVIRTRSLGETKPVTQSESEKSSSTELKPDRRVTVTSGAQAQQARPGTAVLVGKYSVQLPDGGVIWATEDPALGTARMEVSAPSLIAYDGHKITKPIRFMTYSNYSSFLRRAEIRIYRASDVDLIEPIAVVPLTPGAVVDAEWDGAFTSDVPLKVGDELVYVVRAWGAKDSDFDETFARRFQLTTPEEAERGASLLRESVTKQYGTTFSAEEAERRSLTDQVFGADGLRQQNIPLYGSRVRIQGRDLPERAGLTINGRSHPVDLERKMVAEYLVPTGKQTFDIELRGGESQQVWTHQLEVDVTGRYMFMVGIADLTLSQNDISGSVEPLAPDDRFNSDFLAEGRLAFYLKGKIKGKYLITAQADTDERELGNMFDKFFDADPQDVFRRLDPDLYYPVYGDDSTTYRDVDTQGKLYVRVDWDKNQALFGNFETGITGTEYAQYSRALYGAAASLRSRRTNAWGNPGSELKAFASKAQSLAGHSEFLGTTGSLYYLKHGDILPGSDRAVIELRDPTTGRVEDRITLTAGADYEIDEFQGRILLTKPLGQVAFDRMRSITRDAPLDGYEQILLVDYEYVPSGINLSETTVGARGKHWFGDFLAIGGTWIDEKRSGDDYSLKGVDATLQAGKGTYLKVEHSRTKSTSAPVFYSSNGGLDFTQINNPLIARRGDATAVEARANFKELGWTKLDASAAAWWRDVDAGYSVSRFDTGLRIEEYGAEAQAQITPEINIYGRYSDAERGLEALTQAQLTAEWQFAPSSTITGEIRHIDEQRVIGSGEGTLAALRYTQRVNSKLDVYGGGQVAFNRSGAYQDNDAIIAGAKLRFGELSTIGAEVNTGDRGDGIQLNAEYRLSPDHTFYGAYTYSTDRTDYDPLFNRRTNNGWTLGQRWRLSNKVSLFNESQWLKTPSGNGINHTYGMDFYPGQGWNLGFTLQKGYLERLNGQALEDVRRRGASVSGGFTNADTQWQSKLEWRKDTGAEQRTQWVTTNRFSHKINDSLRLAARFNYSDTDDKLNPQADAKFIEGNAGFALRPWNTTRWALLGKVTYLYDVSSLAQVGDTIAFYDQKSRIFSLEGIYNPSHNWEFAGKAMRRDGSVRMGRLTGEWADSGATFLAGQVRYGLRDKWHALAEYRLLDVDKGGARHGALVALERDLSQNFRIGVGYSFTQFNDDLTDFDYDHKGFFINLNGRY